MWKWKYLKFNSQVFQLLNYNKKNRRKTRKKKKKNRQGLRIVFLPQNFLHYYYTARIIYKGGNFQNVKPIPPLTERGFIFCLFTEWMVPVLTNILLLPWATVLVLVQRTITFTFHWILYLEKQSKRANITKSKRRRRRRSHSFSLVLDMKCDTTIIGIYFEDLVWLWLVRWTFTQTWYKSKNDRSINLVSRPLFWLIDFLTIKVPETWHKID